MRLVTPVVAMLTASLLALALSPSSAWTRNCVDYRDYLHVANEIEDLGGEDALMVGQHLYVLDHISIHIFDAQTELSPVFLKSFPLIPPGGNPQAPREIALRGNYLYVTLDDALLVVDVTVPDDPWIASQHALDVRSLVFSGDLAYGVDNNGLIVVLDLSSPTQPQVERSIAMAPDIRDQKIQGDVLYQAGWTGFYAYDVSSPDSVVLLDSLGMFTANVSVHEGMAFTSGDTWTNVPLTLVDIHDPENLTVISELPGLFENVVPLGSTMTSKGGRSFLLASSGHFGIQTIDITDPLHPVAMAPVRVHSQAHKFAVHQGAAYIPSASLVVVDIANPLIPEPLGFVPVSGSARGAGDHLFIAHSSGFEVFDISNPGAPMPVGSLGWTLNDIVHSQVQSGYVWVGDGTSLVAVDVGSPSTPMVVGRVDSLPEFSSFTVEDDLLFTTRLSILDVSDPTNITSLHEGNAPVYMRKVFAGAPYLFVWHGRMDLYDVADPTDPLLIDSNYFPVPGLVDASRQGSDFHMVGSSHVFYLVYDVSMPTEPEQRGILFPFSAQRIHVAGDYSFLGHRGGEGNWIFDVSDPTQLRSLSGLGSDGKVVQVLNGMVIMETEDGVALLPAPCSNTTPAAIAEVRAQFHQGAVELHWNVSGGEFLAFEVQRAAGTASDGPFMTVGRLEASARSGVVRYTYRDAGVEPGLTLTYRVVGIFPDGTRSLGATISVHTDPIVAAQVTTFPNPSRVLTQVLYALPRSGQVDLEIFDAAGRRVRTLVSSVQAPGQYATVWDGQDEAGIRATRGIYFAQIRFDSRVTTSRIVLLR